MLKRDSRAALRTPNQGVTMIEVLVTLLIITLGLLGAAGMQSRLQVSEIEAYQRAQAIVLLQDIVDRINGNRKHTVDYSTATSGVLGTGTTLDCSAPATQAAKDLCAWSDTLAGAAETSSGSKVGAMIGARGCIEITSTSMPREAKVSLVWQGLNPTRAPLSTTCGSGLYTDDATRRALVTYVKIGCLQNDPTTGACVTP